MLEPGTLAFVFESGVVRFDDEGAGFEGDGAAAFGGGVGLALEDAGPEVEDRLGVGAGDHRV